MTHTLPPRRGFLGRLAGAVVAIAAAPATAFARTDRGDADETWLRGLNGKHRQVFDTGNFRDGKPLSRVANFLDVYAETYGLRDTDLNAIVGVHGSALGFVFNDSLWAKYELGRRWQVTDPVTKAAATRNPMVRQDPSYDWGVDYSLTRLQSRGVRFIACMRSMRGLSMEIAGGRAGAPAINADLLANLLPGVTPVPAMIVAVNRAQEAGLTYVFA